MKVNKLILFFFLSFISVFASAQETTLAFPVSGDYMVQSGPEDRQRDFNGVSVQSNTFSLLNDGEVVRTYKLLSNLEGRYQVEQYFEDPEGDNPPKEKFSVSMDVVNDNDCYLTVHYFRAKEHIHLVKMQ